LPEVLADYLAGDFLEGEYMLVPLRNPVFSKELRWKNEVKILVFHEGDLGIPYMAHLVQTETGWKLKSFMSQCVCCFGEGTVRTKEHPFLAPCDCCGGKGWGTAAF
jgi:hypothetical protein